VEKKDDIEAPFAFLATYSAESGPEGRYRHLPLGHALREYGEDTRRMINLLSSVYKAAAGSPLVKSLLDSGEIFHPLRFTSGEAYRYLREVALYEESGVLCRIPRWWNAAPRQVTMGLVIGDRSTGELNAQSLLSCSPMMHIEGESISPEEAERILAQYAGLALIKGKWTVVDRETLQKNLDLFKKATKMSSKMAISFSEAVQFLVGMRAPSLGGQEGWSGDVVCGRELKKMLDKLGSPGTVH
jgi:non-specific serine/threonine protein kinase